MKTKYLKYILDNNPYDKWNIYPLDTISSTTGLHINFLENSHFKHDVRIMNRRNLKKINVRRIDNSLISFVQNPRYPTNSKIARDLTKDKLKTEQYLRSFGIKTPESRVYNESDVDIAKKETYKNSDIPVVIKPLNSSFGRGVMLNVNESRFQENWELSIRSLKSNDSQILVQNYIEGFESRVTVIEGEVLSVTLRLPPYVIGNGKDTIEQLMMEKNKLRNECGFLKTMVLKKSNNIKEHLKSYNLSFDSVPSNNEYILLLGVSNIANGGFTIDITDLVSRELKETALDVVAAIPGLTTAGLDFMFQTFDDKNPTLLEVNAYPVLSLPSLPTYGEQKEPAKVYFESIISFDQFINRPKYKYEIKNYDDYIRKYLSLMNRRSKLLNRFEGTFNDMNKYY